MFVNYGCNTANENIAGRIFAKNLSSLGNFKDVEVWGQSTSSYPSFLPDFRCANLARSGYNIVDHVPYSYDAAETYMVGGNKKDATNALTTNPFGEYPKANPMNCYKNGKNIHKIHQGYFNDHRRNNNNNIRY